MIASGESWGFIGKDRKEGDRKTGRKLKELKKINAMFQVPGGIRTK